MRASAWTVPRMLAERQLAYFVAPFADSVRRARAGRHPHACNRVLLAIGACARRRDDATMTNADVHIVMRVRPHHLSMPQAGRNLRDVLDHAGVIIRLRTLVNLAVEQGTEILWVRQLLCICLHRQRPPLSWTIID